MFLCTNFPPYNSPRAIMVLICSITKLHLEVLLWKLDLSSFPKEVQSKAITLDHFICYSSLAIKYELKSLDTAWKRWKWLSTVILFRDKYSFGCSSEKINLILCSNYDSKVVLKILISNFINLPFFLTVGQNNFGNKIPNISSFSVWMLKGGYFPSKALNLQCAVKNKFHHFKVFNNIFPVFNNTFFCFK